MKKLLKWAFALGFLGAAAGGLTLLVLSGRAGMALPERAAGFVRDALKKPAAYLREARLFLFGEQDINKGKPEYYDELY